MELVNAAMSSITSNLNILLATLKRGRGFVLLGGVMRRVLVAGARRPSRDLTRFLLRAFF